MDRLTLEQKMELFTRLPDKQLILQTQKLLDLEAFKEILTNLPLFTLVLNRNRQAVFWGKDLGDILEKLTQEPFGRRPGELFHCIHSAETEYGCGTAEACNLCGAFQTMKTTLETNARHSSELRLTTNGPEGPQSLEFKVTSIPLHVNQEIYILLTLEDISSRKRRDSLEKVFFHDVLNTAGGVHGLIELLNESENPSALLLELLPTLSLETGLLLEEIKSQRELLQAENNELQPKFQKTDGRIVLDECIKLYEALAHRQGTVLSISDSTPKEAWLPTDQTLLRRVIGNMIKNAIEANSKGGEVRVGISQENGFHRFWVQNPQVIPWETQVQVFQRSFSAKGLGRGLGTYSIKLLTEVYLKGRASFVSEAPAGTTFWVDLKIT